MFEEFEEEVQGLEAHLTASPPPPGVIAFYGSSSIRLWDTLADDFPDIATVNLGFGGSTLGGCCHYFDRLVGRTRPGAVVCFAGENDLDAGEPPDAVVANFYRLHEKVAALPGDIPFVYLAIKPSPARAPVIGHIRDVNRRTRDAIAARPQSFWVDTHSPLLQPDGTPRTEFWTDDGIHLNPDGYQVWWQALSARRREIGF